VSARNSPGRGCSGVHYRSDVTSEAGDGAVSTTRVVVVPPERLVGWAERFAQRHGAVTTGAIPDDASAIRLLASDGAVATLHPPMSGRFVRAVGVVEAMATERVGLLVIRKGGFSVGAAQGIDIIAHRTGSRYLQGRTAAGGWSQQRYARRRDNQADAGYALSGKAVEEVVLPLISTLTRVVAGGDRAAVRTVLSQRGLEPIARLLSPAMLAVGPPKRTSLDELVAKARLIRIELTEPTQ
jgi:hypothetical protein